MKLGELKKFKKFLQGKLYNFTNYLCCHFTKPKKKFVRQMIQGIIKSKSCILRRIAISLEEDITVKKTCERLRKYLSNEEIFIQLRQKIIKKASRKINNDTIIVLDDSDLIKSKSEKMEGLSKVPDGSNGHKRGLGYKLINVVAVNCNDNNSVEVIPMMSELYSNDIEIDSSKNILFDQINEIQVSTGNKGIFAGDRYYDDKKLFKEFSDNEADFIIRANNNRNLIYQDNNMEFIKLAKLVDLNVKYISEDGSELEAGALRVEIPLDPQPRKHPQTVEVWLIVGRYIRKPRKRKRNKKEMESLEKGGYFYLYVSIRHLNDDRDKVIFKALQGYKLRWKIEEFHRHVKQDFGWERMQLMDYTSLKTMNILLLAALNLIYSLYSMRFRLYKGFKNIMSDRKRDMGKIVFIYYRITKVVNYIFNSWKLKCRQKYKGQHAEYLQLRIKFR